MSLIEPKLIARRRFLHLMTRGALAGSLPWSLAACGGGGGGVVDPSEPPPGGYPPPDGPADLIRVAALGRVARKCEDLASEALSPLDYLRAVADHMATDSAYVASGVEPETQTAWGVFADRRVHVVTRNRLPAHAPAAPAARLAQLQGASVVLPGAPAARLCHAFGEGFDDGDAAVARLSAMLAAQRYELRSPAPGDARLSTLRAVRGDGFFYLNSHGGASPRVQLPGGEMQAMYSVQSSTPVTAQTEAMPDIRSDMAALRLSYHTAATGERVRNWRGVEVDKMETRYGITAHFVDAYWEFAPDSVVVINACNSGNTTSGAWAAGFIFACHRKGAGLYLGWTGSVSAQGAYSTPALFTDRLLGANAVEPEHPYQRAFAWDLVMTDLQRKGQAHDALTGAAFVAKPRPGSAGNHILAPSIHHLEVDERDRALHILGAFGPRAGRVVIDSIEYAVRSWADERIVVDLPESGAGSRGGVYVAVDGRRSNVRQLTEWVLNIGYEWLEQVHVGLRVDGNLQLRWRADVGPVRERPGEVPTQPVRDAVATRDSGMLLKASGTHARPPDCAIRWSGSADFGCQLDALDGDRSTQGRFIFANLRVDAAARKGHVGLAMAAEAGSPMFVEQSCDDSHKVVTALGLLEDIVDFRYVGTPGTVPLPALRVQFDDNFVLLGRSHQEDELRLWWSDATPAFPPLPQAAV